MAKERRDQNNGMKILVPSMQERLAVQQMRDQKEEFEKVQSLRHDLEQLRDEMKSQLLTKGE